MYQKNFYNEINIAMLKMPQIVLKMPQIEWPSYNNEE